jgi:hypothetical protein
MTDKIPSRVLKTLLQAAQKDLRGEARVSSHMADSLMAYSGNHTLQAIRYKPIIERNLRS